MDPFFARFNLTGPQWGFLRALYESHHSGVPVRLTDLSNQMLIRPPSATVLVDRLVRMGLVERIRQPDDQRSRFIQLTPAGISLVARVMDAHATQIDRVMAGLSSAQMRELRKLMDRLRQHIEDLSQNSQIKETA
jgi:DNA-binding MarR family transcriptional regulator